MAWEGQCCAHFLQVRQKASTPKGRTVSWASGMSVKTLQIRTRGPYFSVSKSPMRPSSPRPAAMASGTDSAVSLPLGTARYPRPRMKAATWLATMAWTLYPSPVAAPEIASGEQAVLA